MDVPSQLKLYSYLLFYLVPMPKAFEFPFQFCLIWIFLAAILVWFSDILAGDTKSIVESFTKGRFWKLQIKLFIRQNLFILFLVYKFLRQCSRRHTNTCFRSAMIRKQYFDNFDTDCFFFRHRRRAAALKSAKQIIFLKLQWMIISFYLYSYDLQALLKQEVRSLCVLTILIFAYTYMVQILFIQGVFE